MSSKAKMIVFIAILLFFIGANGCTCYNDNKIEPKENKIETSELVCDVRKYYYNQLTLEEQILYDNIESSKEEIMKNQEICIGELKSPYNEAKENAEKILNRAIWAYKLDNPIATIWFNEYKRYLITQSSDSDISTFAIMISPKENSYYHFENQIELQKAIQEVEAKVEKFVSKLSGSDEEKLRSIHNWILQDTLYDESLQGTNIHNLYGAIIQKRCVCGGFAYSFKYVADKAGIPVVSVLGRHGIKSKASNQSINHAWNEMLINGKWYLLDLTEDLPVNLGDEPQDRFFKLDRDDSRYDTWKVFEVP